METLYKNQSITSFWSILAIMAIIFMFLGAYTYLMAGEYIVPPTGAKAFFQTNGPNDPLRHGDWWSSNDASAGNQPHMFELYVPCQVDSDFVIQVELYDPESFQTGTEIDEFEGTAWDSTTFVLVAPDSVTEVARKTFAPDASTSEIWNAFASFTVRQYGCGVYRLYVTTENDDQNAYKIKIVESDPDGVANNGDEIHLAAVETSFQHDGGGCSTFWFFVGNKPELRLSNFDMDDSVSVVYTDADGAVYNGTVSGGTVWNNGGSATFPPPGGDVFTNPALGWWQAELCLDNMNQYVFYSGDAIFIDSAPPFPIVSISKDDGKSTIYTRENVTYTLIVSNSGTGPALNTTVTDTIPQKTLYISASNSPGYTNDGTYEIITWDLGTLLPGESDTLSLTIHINADAPSSLTNRAYVSHGDVFFNEYDGIYDEDTDVVSATGSIGDYVWQDTNSDGLQDASESGLSNVTLYLVDSVGDTIDTQTTDSDGAYLFDVVHTGDYTVYVDQSTLPPSATLTTSNLPLPVSLAEGQNYADADFGYNVDMIPVELSSFEAVAIPGKIVLRWTTQTETENLGFDILRSTSMDGPYQKINTDIIKGAGTSASANNYVYEDEDIEDHQTYYYKLIDIDLSGTFTVHGPVSAVAVTTPSDYSLEQNYPNPFNPETTIRFTLRESGFVSMTIYNMRGQKIRSLVSKQMEAGAHSVVWDGRDENGNIMSSGIYLCTMRVNKFEQTRSLVFMR